VGEWTRRAAGQTRDELTSMLDVLGADDDVLARSFGPERSTLKALPEAGPTAWMQARNGQAPVFPAPGHPANMPDAAFCAECSRPSALTRRYVCVTHRPKEPNND
jgi:hypothetical protein